MTGERRPFDVLYRHFSSSFLDNDLISPASDLHGPLSKAAAAIGMIGLLYPFRLLFRYGRPFREYAELDMLSWSDKCTFVMIALVVMGLLTVIEWDALQLDRRDCRSLGALPIRPRTILLAKLAALAKFVLVFSVPLTLLGALTFPVVMHAGWQSGVMPAARTMAGHAVGTLAASWFAFFSLLAANSLILGALGPRVARRLASAVQLAATVGLIAALLMLPLIASGTAALKHAAGGLGSAAPQMWFMGIYQVIAGQGDPGWEALAIRGWIALLVAAGLGVGASLLAYARTMASTLESAPGSRNGPSWIARAVDLAGRLIVRHPVERGFFSFTALTILRSPWHRVVLAVFLGGALALSIVTLDVATLAPDGARRIPMRASHALAMQFVILAILLTGVRVAASVPSELRATWVLRMLEGGRPDRWMAGFRKAVFVSLVLPVASVMAVATWLHYEWHAALEFGLAAVVFAGLAFDAFFLGFGRVPFACAVAGDSGDPKIRGALTAAVFTILVVPAAELITLALRSAAGTVIALVFASVLAVLLRWRGNLDMTRGGGLAFEPDDQGTQALGLQP